MRTILIAFIILTGCTPKYFFPEVPSKDPVYQNQVSEYSANQFRIVVLPDDNQTRVRMEIRYTVGSKQDPPGKDGLAHLVEHLMFAVPIDDEPLAESFGTSLGKLTDGGNAYTNLDSTSYLSVFAPERLREVFALEVVRMKRGCLGLKEDTFLQAREIVRNEARESAHDIGRQLQVTLHEFIYGENHPYRSSVLGTDETISTLTRNDACEFIQKNYVPSNTIIVISGPVRPVRVKELTKLWMRSFSSKKRSSRSFPKEGYLEAEQQTRRLDVASPYLIAVWPLDKKGTKEYRLQSLAIRALDQMIAKQVEKRSWALTSRSMLVGGAQAPALATIVVLQNSNDIPKAKKLIADATKKVLSNKGNETGRFPLQRNLLLEYEDHTARSSLFADYAQFQWRGPSLTGQLKELRLVTAEQIEELTEELFGKTPPRFLTILPDSNRSKERIPESFKYTNTSPKQARQLAPSDETLSQVEKDLPLPSHMSEVQAFQRYRLPNGLNVLLWQNDDLPLVHTRLLIPIGASDAPADLKGISNLLRGADDYDVTVFSSTFMSENAHVALYKLASDFKSTKRIYGNDEFAYLKRSLHLGKNRVANEYRSRLREAIYGSDHPYTRVEYDEASLARLTPSAVQSWAKKHRTVHEATLIVTGRFDPQLMYQHILYLFKDAPSFKSKQRRDHSSTIPSRGEIVVGYQESRRSTKLSITFRGRNGIGSLQPARDVLVTILNNRIAKLREQHALTYGMQARYSPERGLGSWWISGDVDADRSAEAITVLLDVVSELRSTPAGFVAEFADARRIALAQFTRAKLTAAQSASRLTELARYQLEDDYFESYAWALSRLRPSDVEDLLIREFDLNQAVFGIFGPKASVDSAMRSLTRRNATPQKTKTPTQVKSRTAEKASAMIFETLTNE